MAGFPSDCRMNKRRCQGQGSSRHFRIDRSMVSTNGRKLFTDRQLLTLGTFVSETRRLPESMAVPEEWRNDGRWPVYAPMRGPQTRRPRQRTFAHWTICSTEKMRAIRLHGSPCRSCGISSESIRWRIRSGLHLRRARMGRPLSVDHALNKVGVSPRSCRALLSSSSPPRNFASGGFDVICTDPPYYDAIPYSDLMDFFHVWLRRSHAWRRAGIRSRLRQSARPEMGRGQRVTAN